LVTPSARRSLADKFVADNLDVAALLAGNPGFGDFKFPNYRPDE
jgi:hypothetical protein